MNPNDIDPWFKVLAPLGAGLLAAWYAWLNYRGRRLEYQHKVANPPTPAAGLPQPLAALYVDQRAVEDIKRSLDNLVIATEKSALSNTRKADEMHDLTRELRDMRAMMELERKARDRDEREG